MTNIQNRLVISIVLGLLTAVFDYFVHEGMFGFAVTEAIVTGLGAAVLSCLVGMLIERRRRRRGNSGSGAA